MGKQAEETTLLERTEQLNQIYSKKKEQANEVALLEVNP